MATTKPTKPCGSADPQYDLTQTLAPYMDSHFLVHMIEFLASKELYPEPQLLAAKLELLKNTNMVDFHKETYQQLNNTTKIPQEMEDQRDKVVSELKFYREECNSIVELVENEEEMAKLTTDKLLSLSYLEEHYNITPEIVESFYRYSKLKYECGQYPESNQYLDFYCQLMSNTSDQYLNALWGKLASAILSFDQWEEALADLQRLMETIELKRNSSPLEQLQQRTWLLHWSLFIFCYYPESQETIVNIMLQPRYLEAIQTNAPWLLRYLCVGVVIHKRRRYLMRDLVRALNQEKMTYRDPLLEFIEVLYNDFDFDSAEEILRKCENVVASDIFLHEQIAPEFMENARICMFEMYCRIHEKIDISVLAKKLAMDGLDAERWLVDLIRNARLDAKIDSQQDFIIMGSSHRSVYQEVVDKTRDLAMRTSQMVAQVGRATAQDRK